MPDYDEKHPYSTIDFVNTRKSLPPAFDFERLTRFMSYGFLMSPIQFHWFAFLSRAFPITKQSSTMPALQRVCFDQLIFAPMGQSHLLDITCSDHTDVMKGLRLSSPS